ncbi:MAG: HlyD family efflux transporter periplasmic adaptor subunit [Bdellovibrionales bacterium]|nr:HlyD family efflux transporter periplasmic adaptor subunit [Bdellovibrionales bacterium]
MKFEESDLLVHRRAARNLLRVCGLILLALLFLPWIQTVPGKGRVVAFSPTEREQRILAPIDGRIKQWFIMEGTLVKKGDPLVELMDVDPDIVSRLELEKSAAQKKIEASKLGIITSRKNLDRQQKLFEEGISSKRNYELANLELVKYLTDEANAVSELARIEVRLARQAAQLVSSPSDGVILKRLTGQEGDLIKAGAELSVLIPNTKSRAVELWVRGNDMPLIQKDQEVRLQFEGWPAIQFSGWPSVAVGTFPAKVIWIDPTSNEKGEFRTMVVPVNDHEWPNPSFLRQGVRAVGWVSIKAVSIGYELWRQFNAFPIAPEKIAGSPKAAEEKK